MDRRTGAFRGGHSTRFARNARSDNRRNDMLKLTAFLLAIALVFASVTSAEAAKGGKRKKPKPTPEQIFKKFDKDGDGKLTSSEFEKIAARDKSETAEKVFK